MSTAPAPAPPHWLLLLCEVLLGATTFAVVLGFTRVFEGSSYATPLLVVALGSHLLIGTLRRNGVGVGWTLVTSGAAFVLLASLVLFGETTTFGLPTGATLQAARDALAGSAQTFQQVVAPAPAEPGFLLAASFGLFVSVFLADWAAFRLWSGLEAVIPAFTLFVFCALLGAAQHQVVVTVLFAGAALGFLAAHRSARRASGARWVGRDPDTGTWTMVRTGLVLVALAAVVGGVLIGARLPGADTPALISWRDRGDAPGDRFTVSPLVEINSRLVDQSDVELFTVRSSEPAYWRLTSLDTFDGSSWRSKGRFTDAGGDLGRPPETVATRTLVQDYAIERLGGLWMPAAMIPTELAGEGRARFHEDSSTLIVDSDIPDSDGYRYRITSAVPAFDPDALRRAGTAVPEDIAQRYLGLPANFSAAARDWADTVTAGRSTTYDRMRALQDWFHTEFTYDLSVGPGHGGEAIDRFLAMRRGYCEQFAGTFAAMARHLGIPARVAVGFTQGETDPQDPGLYRVRGLHAHAWPEVWIGEYGWVPFEPTPSRGAPGAEAWTGLAPQQGSADDLGDTGSTTTIAAPTTTVAPTGGPTTTVAAGEGREPALGTGGPAEGVDEPGGALAVAATVLAVLVGLLSLAGGWIGALWFADRRLRRSAGVQARRLAHRPDERVRRAWSEALDHLELVGIAPRPSETHTEFASRRSDGLGEAGDALVEMARTTDLATFAPHYVDDRLAARAEQAASAVEAEVHARMEPNQRARSLVDPRPVWRAYRRG